MPNRSRLRRSKTVLERLDALLRGNSENRDHLQSIYYGAQQATLRGMRPEQYAEMRLRLSRPEGLAWKLGYDYGRFLLLLKKLGFEV